MPESTRIEELRRRVQMDPASIAFAALAEEYRRAGRFEESIATCQAGLQRHPAYLSARVTLGRSLLELGRYDEAREQLERVLQVAPENLAATRGLAEIQARTDGARTPGAREDRPAAAPPPPTEALQSSTSRSDPPPPMKPVRLSVVPPTSAGRVQPPPDHASEVPTLARVPTLVPAPKPVTTAATRDAAATSDVAKNTPAPDPALPALESFLGAIIRARASRPSGSGEP